MISANTSQAGKGVVRSTVPGRHLPMSRWRSRPPQSSVSRSGFSLPKWWPALWSEPAPRLSSVSYCARSSPENDLLCWSAARNKFAHRLVVEAVGVRFFAPGTTPEMPLRAATCREAQDGHRPCEAAGHPFRGRRLRHIRWRSVAAGEVDWRMCSIRKVLYSGRRWRLNHAPTQ
jgi:hypothetical protein